MASQHNDYDSAAKKIIERVGRTIVLGVPIGIGKPIGLLNALYNLAKTDSSIQLTIITGLTLARPILKNELEKRLVEPILDRILQDHIDPLYERARELQVLPNNIRIIEFFLTPGKYLHNDYVQQNYISSNYTEVAHDSQYYAINVLAQQIVRENNHYSLSCNTDLFHTTANYLKNCGRNIAIVGEINLKLPFMLGREAVVNESHFTDLIDTGQYPALFCLPKEAITAQEHLIGIYTSCLIKDNGCLQIGIGNLSMALANALIFRDQHNDLYRDLLQQLTFSENFNSQTMPFEKGLYASTEMLSDEYMQLYLNGIIKKRVYDHIGLQQLLNADLITEDISPHTLDVLLQHRIIETTLTAENIEFLLHFGILQPDIRYHAGNLILNSGEVITADLSISKSFIIEKCLGKTLQAGKCMQAGFFIGSGDFYQQLHQLSKSQLQQIEMTSIAITNSLTENLTLYKLQRQNARFVNSAIMISLGGEIITDTLKDLRELSGVGGQFDFMHMAYQLENAHSIILCRSTRETNKGMTSNIVWEYPHLTAPRFFRDIVITEYGIADLRSKTDAEIIKAMLNIADSRFQPQLLKQAKLAGKIPTDYAIPHRFLNNYPHTFMSILNNARWKRFFPEYPFGSELTEVEKALGKSLLFLQKCSKFKLFTLFLQACFSRLPDANFKSYLIRMKLDGHGNFKDFIYKKLLKLTITKIEIQNK